MTNKNKTLIDRVYTFNPDNSELVVAPEIIRMNIGYPRNHNDNHIDEMIDKVIRLSKEKIDIQSGFKIYDNIEIYPNRTGMEIGGKEFQTQKIITSQMRKAESAALFLCTIGPQMENWSQELIQEGELLRGYIVDAVASESVEKAMDLTHDYLEQLMRQEGLGITNRFSPGYCRWPVSDQHILFSLLPPGFCGITLTESSLMVPVKSVSGFIGIGPDAKRQDYACNICDDTTCFRKKIKS
ncbi:methionine synthase [candidate division KSB1 bacterium]|nr:methionine synthase [candidate division KSB1 bacterium]